MISLDNFAITLEDILNGTYRVDTPSTTIRPTEYLFRVQTFASNLDKISDHEIKENFIPVFVTNSTGSIQPFPNIQMTAYQFTVNVYVPFTLKNEIFNMFEYLATCIVGKVITFSSTSSGEPIETGVCNMSVPNCTQIGQQTMQQFYEFMQEYYNQEIITTDNWLIYTIEVYVSNAKISSQGNQLIFGNTATYSLTYTTPDNQTFSSELIRNETANSLENAFNAQQLISTAFAKSLISATAYTYAITCYIEDSSFWTTLLTYYANKRINELSFTLKRKMVVKSITGDITIENSDSVLVNMELNEPLGDFMSASIGFTIKEDNI